MSVGAVHAKPQLDGQYGLLGAFQACLGERAHHPLSNSLKGYMNIA